MQIIVAIVILLCYSSSKGKANQRQQRKTTRAITKVNFNQTTPKAKAKAEQQQTGRISTTAAIQTQPNRTPLKHRPESSSLADDQSEAKPHRYWQGWQNWLSLDQTSHRTSSNQRQFGFKEGGMVGGVREESYQMTQREKKAIKWPNLCESNCENTSFFNTFYALAKTHPNNRSYRLLKNLWALTRNSWKLPFEPKKGITILWDIVYRKIDGKFLHFQQSRESKGRTEF